jgi:hypothetical protein
MPENFTRAELFKIAQEIAPELGNLTQSRKIVEAVKNARYVRRSHWETEPTCSPRDFEDAIHCCHDLMTRDVDEIIGAFRRKAGRIR